MKVLLSSLVATSVVACAVAQQSAAILDPTGVFEVEVGGVSWQLRFPELLWPVPGEHELGAGGVAFGRSGDGGFVPVKSGRLVVRALDADHADLTVVVTEPGTEPSEIVVGRPVELRRLVVPEVRGRPERVAVGELLSPEADDLVFCAIGSAGTGLPGQRRVAASVGRIAKEQAVDFVLLLGDQFQPDGAERRDDPIFQRRFEDVFPAATWPNLFYAVNGDAEVRGDRFAPLHYSATSLRFSMSAPSYAFTHTIGDHAVQFVAIDTRSIVGSVADPMTRAARSIIPRSMTGVNPGWRIVFGHDPYYSHGVDVDTALAETLRNTTGSWLSGAAVDLYISGGTHVLELLGPKDGVLHVSAGGGGGPEVARTVDWQDDTKFAATAGGSVWFRVRPAVLEIAFRDVDGELLFVHHAEKSR